MKQSAYNVWVDRPEGSFVYNGMSGAVLRVAHQDRAELDRWLDPSSADEAPATLIKDLRRGRMVIADEVDELDVLRRRYRASQADRRHLGLTLVTSLGCNLDCPYCFEAKHPSIMDDAVERALLRLVERQLPDITDLGVTWYGGEPLVGRKPLLELSDQFIARCDAVGVQYTASIVTNGYLLSERVARELAQRRVRSASVTLDGPPEVHDARRPRSGGKGSFWRILENVRAAMEHLSLSIRVNLDSANAPHAEQLMQLLADHGLAGRCSLVGAQVVAADDGVGAPSSSYSARCFGSAEFARVKVEFDRTARRYGFSPPTLPHPIATPCTAVRRNEIVVGSRGELYKCWESVGDPREVIGHISQYDRAEGRAARWLDHDPFADEECCGCIALPVCMGGCAHHAMDELLYENRCDSFRHSVADRVEDFVDWAAAQDTDGPVQTATIERYRVDGR